jgi:hypothetical protein
MIYMISDADKYGIARMLTCVAPGNDTVLVAGCTD